MVERQRPRLLGSARLRDRRGGIKSWTSVRDEIVRRLRKDTGLVVTTMLDYYGLPGTGARAWPAFGRGIGRPDLGDAFQQIRDAFGNPEEIDDSPERAPSNQQIRDAFGNPEEIDDSPERAPSNQQIRDAFGNPEEIDDSPERAPSKRVERIVPRYQKPVSGLLAAQQIGIVAMRRECPNFESWLDRLEQLPGSG